MQGTRLMAINESLSFDFLDTNSDRCRFLLIGSGLDRNEKKFAFKRERACIYENMNIFEDSASELIQY